MIAASVSKAAKMINGCVVSRPEHRAAATTASAEYHRGYRVVQLNLVGMNDARPTGRVCQLIHNAGPGMVNIWKHRSIAEVIYRKG
jgi:hypothetical protein